MRERERRGKKRKENKAGRKEMTADEGGEERERERAASARVSVGKYLSNSFHSVKASPLLFSLQT